MRAQIPLLPYMFRWYFQKELPGWGKIYSALNLGGIDNVNSDWSSAPVVTARGKYHKYLMELDLRNDLNRYTYFTGRYYDLAVQLALDCFLRAGDAFIDGGANVGMTMLHAARNVGPNGKVLCFEPLPENCAKVERLIALNSLSHVSLFPEALGDGEGQLTLNVLGGDTIMATLRPGANLADRRMSVQVPVTEGDKYADLLTSENVFIKLDLEGWEYYALIGFRQVIEKFRPPILVEIEPKYLREAGVEEGKLHEFFVDLNYKPYVVGVKTSYFSPPQLRLWEYQSVQDLAQLNEAGSRRFKQAQSKLGRDFHYIDVIWLPAEYSRIDYRKHLVSLE